MNRQVTHIQTMAITVAGEVLPSQWQTINSVLDFPYKPGQGQGHTPDKLRTTFGQSQIQPPFQDLAPGWKQPLPDNKPIIFCYIYIFSVLTDEFGRGVHPK